MLLLENKKHINKTDIMPIDSRSTKNNTRIINDISQKQLASLSQNTSRTLFNFKKLNFHKRKNNPKRNLPNPKSIEVKLTPHAKKCIKAFLSPIAVISYILQESSMALNKVLAATTSFLMFSLLNCFTSASFGSYEIKLPMLSICLIGSILGAKKMVNAIKKTILSIPTGIHTCSQNISCDDCSIFDFICGIDKRKKSLVRRIFKLS